MRIHIVSFAAIAALAAGCSAGAGSGEPEGAAQSASAATLAYRIDAVPTLVAGGTSAAYAIDDNGVVAGASQTRSSASHAIRWVPGSAPADLGTFPGGATSTATGLDIHGDVIGEASVSTVASHAFFGHAGAPIKDIGHLAFGGLTPAYQTVSATGINASGVVVGVSPLQLGAPSYSEYSRAFRWSGGVMTDLGSVNGTTSAAFAINDSGTIAGMSATDTSAGDAVIWSGGALRDLGVCPGASTASANAINARGDVAGSCFFVAVAGYGGHPSFTDAFVWTSSGGLRDLGSVGDRRAVVSGIGADDTVIGMLSPSRAAFVIYPGGAPRDLNTIAPVGTSWHLGDARAINARGQIVGNGTLNGVARGYVLTPL